MSAASDQSKTDRTGARTSTSPDVEFLYNGEIDENWPQLQARYLKVSDRVTEIPDRFCQSDVPVHLDLSGASNLQVIGKSAFQCASLTTIVWPAGGIAVTREEGGDMEKEYLDGSAPPRLREIRDEAFAACRSLEELDLSNLHHLTSIGQASFALCSALKKVKMTPQLEQIGEGAFAGCQALREIHWNGMPLTELQANSFGKCYQLTCLDLSHLTQLGAIGARVFKECTGLEHVKFPSTLGSIGVGGFYGCESLKEVQFASQCTAPTRELQIGQAAFAKCSALVSFDLPGYVTRLAPLTLWGCLKLEKVNLRSTLESIGGSALGNCVSLKEVVLPSTMKEESIGPNAFFKCPNELGTDVWYWYFPRHENDYDQNIFEDGQRLPSVVTKVKIVALDQKLVPSLVPIEHPNGKDALESVDIEGNDLLSAIQLSLMYPRATTLTLPMNRLIRMYNKAPMCRSEISAEINDRRRHFFSDAFGLIMFEESNDEDKRNIMKKLGDIQLAHTNTIHQLVSRRVGLDLPFEPFAFLCE